MEAGVSQLQLLFAELSGQLPFAVGTAVTTLQDRCNDSRNETAEADTGPQRAACCLVRFIAAADRTLMAVGSKSGASGEQRAVRISQAGRPDRGYRRIQRGRGFSYVAPGGNPVRDPRTLARVRALAVPPAWRDVWINRDPAGHIQATGHDARGRLQYRYHPAWRQQRDRVKFARMARFGASLPRIRAEARRAIGSRRLTREGVVAAAILLLDATAGRVGSEAYASTNHTYGVTTLRRSQVQIQGPRIHLRYRGKGSRVIEVDLEDAALAGAIARCAAIPGARVFKGPSVTGATRPVTASDINRTLRTTGRGPFSAKDFRTWSATVLAADLLHAVEPPSSDTQARRMINEALDQVAAHLGNTRAVCRASYVAPEIIQAFLDGRLQATRRGTPRRGLTEPESFTLRVLERAPTGDANYD